MGKHTGNVCRLQSRSSTPQAGPAIMSRWTEDCLSCPHLCCQLQHITSLQDILLSLFLKKRKKKKRRGTKKPIPFFGSIIVTVKTATKIYQNLHECVVSCFSCVRHCVTLWTVALQAPLSMVLENGQEYLSGLPCSPSGDLLDPGIEPASPESPALQVGSSPLSSVKLLSRV